MPLLLRNISIYLCLSLIGESGLQIRKAASHGTGDYYSFLKELGMIYRAQFVEAVEPLTLASVSLHNSRYLGLPGKLCYIRSDSISMVSKFTHVSITDCALTIVHPSAWIQRRRGTSCCGSREERSGNSQAAYPRSFLLHLGKETCTKWTTLDMSTHVRPNSAGSLASRAGRYYSVATLGNTLLQHSQLEYLVTWRRLRVSQGYIRYVSL